MCSDRGLPHRINLASLVNCQRQPPGDRSSFGHGFQADEGGNGGSGRILEDSSGNEVNLDAILKRLERPVVIDVQPRLSAESGRAPKVVGACARKDGG